MSEKRVLDAGCIGMKGMYESIEIVNFHMIQEKNKHAEVFIEGFVPEDKGYQCISRNEERLVVVKKGETEEIIFSGLVRKVDILYKGNDCTVLIYGISASILLEEDRKFRSFQNVSCTGQDIIREVLKDIPEAEAVFFMPDDPINAPLIQYDETNWEFILRVCSLYHASVFVDIESGKPRVYCGLPNRGMKENLRVLDEVWKFDEAFYSFLREGEKNRKLVKRDFLTLQIHTYESLHIGEQISGYQNGRVQGQTCSLKNGILEYVHIIANKKYSESYPIYNEKIRGASILGTVLDVREESVKIWLELDREQAKDIAYWYQWLPESGNGLYCMPEVGAQVYLYIGGKNEKDAIVVGCRNDGRKSSQDRTRPQNKGLELNSLKKMNMFPESLVFSNQKKERNNLEINMQPFEMNEIRKAYALYYYAAIYEFFRNSSKAQFFKEENLIFFCGMYHGEAVQWKIDKDNIRNNSEELKRRIVNG